jgi:hypothetical protein
MSAKLDLEKPYGAVFGGGPYSYEQDGKFFRHDGTEYVPPAAEGAATAAKTEPSLLDGNAETVKAGLAGMSAEDLTALRGQEEAGKTRKGVIAAIDEALAALSKPAATDDELANQLNG